MLGDWQLSKFQSIHSENGQRGQQASSDGVDKRRWRVVWIVWTFCPSPSRRSGKQITLTNLNGNNRTRFPASIHWLQRQTILNLCLVTTRWWCCCCPKFFFPAILKNHRFLAVAEVERVDGSTQPPSHNRQMMFAATRSLLLTLKAARRRKEGSVVSRDGSKTSCSRHCSALLFCLELAIFSWAWVCFSFSRLF